MLAHIFQEPEKLLIWNNEINLESEGLHLDLDRDLTLRLDLTQGIWIWGYFINW